LGEDREYHNNSFIFLLLIVIMFNAADIKLKEYQHKNGLFPASPNSDNSEMNKFWIRDNYYIYLAVRQDIKKKMVKAFQNITDYLRDLGKFDYKPTEDWMYIHPRYNENLKEIPGEWSWLQNDVAGNLLEILSDARDGKRARLIVDYLNTIKYWNLADYGFWEESPKEIRSSSLASCIRGLEKYHKKIQKNKNPSKNLKQMIYKGYEKLYSLLPNETKTRKYDLALLSLIYPKQIISDDMKEIIIMNTKNYLEKTWGVKRYLGDTWNGKENNLGKGKEMQWTMGLPWLYLCTKETNYLLRAIKIKQKFGTMPEGIINGWPNCTKHLLWSEAMYKLALDEFKKQDKFKKIKKEKS